MKLIIIGGKDNKIATTNILTHAKQTEQKINLSSFVEIAFRKENPRNAIV